MNFKEYLAANLTEGSPYAGCRPRGPLDNPNMRDCDAKSERDANELLAATTQNKDAKQHTADKDKLRLTPAEERRAKARKIAMAKAKREESFIGRFLRKIGAK